MSKAVIKKERDRKRRKKKKHQPKNNMWSIFNQNPKPNNLEWMQVDMHSHILPGLDDGCQSKEQSLQLLDRLTALGLSQFYLTPHIFPDLYSNNPEKIGMAFADFQKTEARPCVKGYAAEYMVDSHFGHLLATESPTLATLPGNHVLIEMSYIQESKNIEGYIFDLQVKGYKPILAHPERYVFYHQDPKPLLRFKDLGCLLQLNILSIFGYYGANEKRLARHLLDKGLIDFVGTDVHHERHVTMLEKGLSKKDIRPYFKKCKIQNKSLL
ncbi:tyrosine-protein phosphatase [Sphingobacterium sp. LRF_L2]|uniref:tyrosine-protein phosphatase n=1 Tax=Sphingobacterium sp. LRF_L2 TaxID=3369421 RepID=UPI003F5DB8D9